jgi:hypothetical protein
MPAEADLEDADRRLSVAVQERIVRTSSPLEDRPVDPQPRPSTLALILDYFRRQPLRPILAAAAVVVIVFTVRMAVHTPGEISGPRTLRGETTAGEIHPVLEAPRLQPTGELLLSWRPVERAETYRVVFYRSDMSEFTRYEPGSQNSLRLDAGTLETLAETQEPLYWGVTALRGRDEISRSPIRVFGIPNTP